MKHCIIVKWNDGADKKELLCRAQALFENAKDVPCVMGTRLLPCCIDRANRFDLAIVLDMKKEALPEWDACALHIAWKENFKNDIASKAIFDFE